MTHALKGEGFDASEDGTGRGVPLVPIMGTLAASDGGVSGKDAPQVVGYRTTGNDGCYETGDRVGALNTGTDQNATVMIQASTVRRLTPRECERLQGFPDDHTAVPYRGKSAADGPRYKALGNSIAVPCLAHIGANLARALGLNTKNRNAA